MEFGKTSIEKKLQDYKLLKAKYERQEKALIDDSVFRKKTVPEIIRALQAELLGSMVVADQPSPYMGYELPGSLEKSSPKSLKEVYAERKKLDKALEDYINKPGKTLSDFMSEKQIALNKAGSEIYKPVLMTRQTYSKLLSNQTKEPSFETCVQLMFGYELNLEEANEMLRLVGKAFSDSDYHRTVKFFIENKNYDFDELNKKLIEMEHPPIGCE